MRLICMIASNLLTMTIFQKLGRSALILTTLATSIFSFSMVKADAKSALKSDNNYNVVVSKYADLAIRYKSTLLDPYYVPAKDELSKDRAGLATSSLNNALFVFPDKNGDQIFRISIIPKDYNLGESIDGMKALKGIKGTLIKSYFTPESVAQIKKVVVYNIPASKQAEYKANTTVRFSTYSGKIYSFSLNKLKANPGIKIQFDSLSPSTENLKRKELGDQNRVEFYK